MTSTLLAQSQAELDKALADGVADLRIEHPLGIYLTIADDPGFWLTLRGNTRAELWGNASADLREHARAPLRENTRATLWGNASATLWENARATLRENTRATLWGNASATLWGNASADLRENARATLRENARAVLWGNASAELWGNTRATLRENTSATLWGNASADLRENARATLRENARAELWGNASATLWGNASAELWGNTRAVLWGNSHAELWGNASADLRENARAPLRENTSATLWGNSSATRWGNASAELSRFTVAWLRSPWAKATGTGHVIDMTAVDLGDPALWADFHGVKVVDGIATVYKALKDHYGTDRLGWEGKYAPGETPEAPDWRDDASCGGGLHFSPTPRQASEYLEDATRWVKVGVELATLRPILDGGTPKCEAPKVVVPCVEVDINGEPVEV